MMATRGGAVGVTLALLGVTWCHLASLGVVKDNAESVTHAAADAAHTMPKIDAIFAPRSFDWAIVDGECYRVALS